MYVALVNNGRYWTNAGEYDTEDQALEAHSNDVFILLRHADGDISVGEEQSYQDIARSTAVYPDKTGLQYTILGLCGEAGEIANKYKKVLRGDVSLNEAKAAMLDELGDVLWYAAMIANELGTPLSQVMEANVKKLAKRKIANTLKGAGDDR